MSRPVKYLLVVALVLLALVLFLWRQVARDSRDDAALVAWGGGELAPSESAYYGDRIGEIVGAWWQMDQRAAHDEEGHLREPYHTFLVLDANRREVWIEESGQVLEEYRSELPAQMTWAVYHDTGSGAMPLGHPVRLKCRGVDRARRCPEVLWLVGQRTDEYLAVHFDGPDQGRTHARGGGPFRAYHPAPSRKPGVPYYDSILVNDAEYEQARRSWADAPPPLTPGRGLLTTTLDENQAAWAKVRKKMHQAIEGQVRRAGFELRHLQVRPGPDYSAAHAQMQVARESFISSILGRTTSLKPCLMIDHLGDDVWYAQIGPNPQGSAPRPNRSNPAEELPLEFLVTAEEALAPAARREWLQKGRTRQREYAESQGRWTVTLANGAVVRFLGVCEHPSMGKQWWGPDGRPIDYAPCFPVDPEGRGAGGRRVLAFAWQVEHPALHKPQGLTVQHHLEDGSIFNTSQCHDRYGVALPGGHHESYTFDESQKTTTLTVATNLSNQGPRTVKFRNLSLVPGQDQGFEIEVVK